MQSKFQKSSLIFPIIFLVFSSGIFLFLNWEINKNKEESEKMFLNWQTENVQRNEIRSLNNSIKTIQSEKDSIETHFAKSSNIVPFLNTIEGFGSKVGTKTEINSVDLAKDETGLFVSLKTTGSFEAVYKFLMLLENSPYEIDFISVNMGKYVTTNLKETNWELGLKIKLLSFMQ